MLIGLSDGASISVQCPDCDAQYGGPVACITAAGVSFWGCQCPICNMWMEVEETPAGLRSRSVSAEVMHEMVMNEPIIPELPPELLFWPDGETVSVKCPWCGATNSVQIAAARDDFGINCRPDTCDCCFLDFEVEATPDGLVLRKETYINPDPVAREQARRDIEDMMAGRLVFEVLGEDADFKILEHRPGPDGSFADEEIQATADANRNRHHRSGPLHPSA